MTQGLLCRNETKGNPILKTNASSKLGHTVYGLNFSPHWPLSQMSLCSELPAQPRITDLLGAFQENYTMLMTPFDRKQ